MITVEIYKGQLNGWRKWRKRNLRPRTFKTLSDAAVAAFELHPFGWFRFFRDETFIKEIKFK